MGDSKKRLKPRKPPICFGCGQSGHFRRDCPKAKKGTSHKAKTAGEKSSADSNSAYAASKDCPQNHTWLVDSGASSHMTWNKQLLVNYKEFEIPEKVGLGDGCTSDALGTGEVHLQMQFNMSYTKKSIMYKVLYLPQLTCNLFSVRAAASKGNFIKFGHSRCWIRDSDGKLSGMGTLLYQLDCETITPEQASVAMSQVAGGADIWHFRLGHASERCIKNMAYKKLVTGIRLQNMPRCHSVKDVLLEK